MIPYRRDNSARTLPQSALENLSMVTFTTGKGFQLAAAVCGAVGTFLLYKGSFAFELPAYWGSPQLTANMDARNKRGGYCSVPAYCS